MAVPPTSARPAVGSSTVRWSVFGLLLAVVLAALVVAFVTVEDHGVGGDPLDKLQSMRHSTPNPSLDHEQALGLAEDFVTRFNTYGPQLLAKDHTMPRYEALADEMSSKFAAVFSKEVPAAEATVEQTKVRSIGKVYSAGVNYIDADTAKVIVASTVTYGYPNPQHKGAWLTSKPQGRRWEVSLVKQDGRWLVDDLDNVDDNLPPFGQSASDTPGSDGGQLPAPSGSSAPTAPSSPKPSHGPGVKQHTGGGKR